MAKSTTSKPLTRLDHLELARLLRRRVAGEPFPHSFIHEADVYSLPPQELVRDRDHAPGTDRGNGKGKTWYFCSPPSYRETKGVPKRKRTVGPGDHVAGGGGGGDDAGQIIWNPEKRKPMRGPDGKFVGAYDHRLSYVLKTKIPGTDSFTKKSLGWIMFEIGLDQHGADQQQLVLYELYRSPSGGPETSTEVSSAGAEDLARAAINGVHEGGVILDESLNVPGGYNMPAPPPASCDNNPHSLGVAREPALPIGAVFKPGGEIPISSRVAIVKKADAAAVTVVMKFGKSSMPSAERMKEMAKLVLRFPADEIVAVILSELGNTTPNILLAARKAMRCGDQKASEIHEFAIIREMYLRALDELGLESSIVSGPLDKLEQHLQYVAITKELTPMTRDYLVSFGNSTSTEMFSGYLNKLGKGTRQEWELRVVTTSGRGSSDLTATTIGKALGSREIQVWTDMDGMFTCDPKVCANAMPVPNLTFDEAAELGYFAEQSIEQAMEYGISVIVKNSYNPQAPGTVITKTRDMSKNTLTSIVLKSNITMLDIKSKRTLGQSDFVSTAFSIVQYFEYLGISVNCAASGEGKISFTLVPSKLLSEELIQMEIDNVVEELQKIAAVHRQHDRSVISLIGNTQMSIVILKKALNVLSKSNVAIEKVTQGSSMVTKVSLVVHGSVAKHAVQVLHAAFFEVENGAMPEVEGAGKGSPVPVNSPVSASSVVKRKAEAPPGPSQERMNPSVLGENDIGGNRGQLNTQSESSDLLNRMSPFGVGNYDGCLWNSDETELAEWAEHGSSGLERHRRLSSRRSHDRAEGCVNIAQGGISRDLDMQHVLGDFQDTGLFPGSGPVFENFQNDFSLGGPDPRGGQ